MKNENKKQEDEELTYVQITKGNRRKLRLVKAQNDFNTMNEAIGFALDNQK